jgi:hypothetical protein
MLRRVALVKTNVSEERSTFIIKVTRIGELGTLAVTSNRRTLLVFLRSVRRLLVILTLFLAHRFLSPSSETSVLIRAARRNIPEDGILHSHRRENLQSYMAQISAEGSNILTGSSWFSQSLQENVRL